MHIVSVLRTNYVTLYLHFCTLPYIVISSKRYCESFMYIAAMQLHIANEIMYTIASCNAILLYKKLCTYSVSLLFHYSLFLV